MSPLYNPKSRKLRYKCELSKVALWATKIHPSINSLNLGSTSFILGALRKSSFVIDVNLVVNSDTNLPGLT